MAIRQPLPRRRRDDDDWSEFHGRTTSEEEFLALDDAEETDLEYYDGAAWRKGWVDRNHGVLAGRLAYFFEVLANAIGGEQGPERRVRLPSGRALKPDAAYWLPGVPSGNDSLPIIAVEVRSPDETMASQRRKCRMYREGGVPVAWLIDPISDSRGVRGRCRRRARAGRRVLRTELVPGLEIPIAELWAALDRDP
jgi:Uma2 family endonuclease